MIPEGHVDEIVSTGITFMNAITHAYGAEEGMKLYDSIMMAVDPDIKGKIFFKMITGDYNSKIRLRGHDIYIGNKIERIKAVRQVADLSLKDAKELVEEVERGVEKLITHQRKLMNRDAAVGMLKQAGFLI